MLPWIILPLLGCAAPAPLPSLYDDPALAAQVETHDGFDGVLVRTSAFVNGAPVQYWTLEGAPERAMPVYVLCRPEGSDPCAPVDHPPIIDRLPGEEGYTAYGQVHRVTVPEGWEGQLGSVDELLAFIDAEDLAAPRPTSELWHCPIAALEAAIEVDSDLTVGPERPVHVRGLEARCFDFSASRPHRAVLPSGELFVRHVYELTRDGEELPLREAARMADLNGDGDQHDTNNIFGVGLDDVDYTPLWRAVRVTVPADLPSIEASPAYTAATDMFDVAPDYTITPREGRIIGHEVSDTLINCPLQSSPGQL